MKKYNLEQELPVEVRLEVYKKALKSFEPNGKTFGISSDGLSLCLLLLCVLRNVDHFMGNCGDFEKVTIAFPELTYDILGQLHSIRTDTPDKLEYKDSVRKELLQSFVKKLFSLSQIAPYFNNPELCGTDKKSNSCQYLTQDGKTCVAGKNMLPVAIKKWASLNISIDSILDETPQEEVFIPDSVGILTTQEWQHLQVIHDRISKLNDKSHIDYYCDSPDSLFTYQELVDYSKKLKDGSNGLES